MIWTDDRTLAFDGDGPSKMHRWTLAVALRDSDAVGDKPSIRSIDGVLISLHFHVDLDAAAKSATESVVAAHDGTVTLAADAAAAEQLQIDEDTKRADLDALRQKRRDGLPLTAADKIKIFDSWLGL